MSVVSEREYIFNLSRELLDDIELARASGEVLMLKASRLARLVDDDEIKTWLQYEIGGYYDTDIGRKYMSLTGRWLDREKNEGFWGPLAQQETALRTKEAQLATYNFSGLSGEWAYAVTNKLSTDATKLSADISRFAGIKTRVLGILHNFVSGTYHALLFERLANSIFERFGAQIDETIRVNAADVAEKIPAVARRLAEGDPESVSQALNTCRRIIDRVADSLFPASDELYDMDGQQISVKADRTQNRINAFVHKAVESKSRRTRIRQNLANLYDRVSTGVHKDVDSEEAEALFLNTYLICGELLKIKQSA